MSDDRTCARPSCQRARRRGYRHCYIHMTTMGEHVPLVDAAPVAEHLERVMGDSAGINALSRQVGVSHTIISRVLSGHTKRLRKSTSDKLLSATQVAPKYLPAWPITRRVRSLRAAGYRRALLAQRCGVTVETIDNLSHRRYRNVDQEVDKAVRKMYRELRYTPVRPADWRTASHEWPVPMAWDDIDDPAEHRGACLREDVGAEARRRRPQLERSRTAA